MKISLILFLTLILFSSASRIIKVLNIFIPSYPNSTFGQAAGQTKTGISKGGISSEYNLGKQLRETYANDLGLSSDNFSQILYFVPADSLTVGSGLAQFFGLANQTLSLSEEKANQILLNDSKLKGSLKTIEDKEYQTIEIEGIPALRDSFRVLPSSLLLEASDFECSKKTELLNQRKNIFPNEIKDKYTSVKQNFSDAGQNPDELFKVYQRLAVHKLNTNSLPEGISEQAFKDLEYVISVYVFANYYDDKEIAKLNAGNLFNRLLTEMNNENGYRIISYGVHQASFMSLLRIFDILNYTNTIKNYKNSSEEATKSLLYPQPGSNLIIEVRLDDAEENVIVAVKYNGVDQKVCTKSVPNTTNHCYLKATAKKYEGFKISNIGDFRRECTSEDPVANTGGFSFWSIFYFIGIGFGIYFAYRILMFVYRVLLAMYVARKYNRQKKEDAERSHLNSSSRKQQAEMVEIEDETEENNI